MARQKTPRTGAKKVAAKRKTAAAAKPAARKAAGAKPVAKPVAKRSRPASASTAARRAAPAAGSVAKKKATASRRKKSAPRVARPATLRGPRAASGRSGAPEIMVTLNNEHRYISSLLEALAEQADNLLPGCTPDYAMLFDIANYMASYPDEYHHPREDLVFNRLLERDPEAREQIQQLLDGHVEISRRSRELLEELTRITRLGAKADNQKLKYLCDRYIGYYWDHINMEEGKVFPRATAKLRQDDWFAINAQARYVDDPLFGARVRKEYQRLSSYLAHRATRITEDVAIAELFGIEALIETVAALSGAVGEAREIVGKRVRKSVSGSRDILGQRAARGESCGGLARPRAIGSTVADQFGAAGEEIGALVRRTRGELSEPFAARMKYLRKLLSES